MRILVINVNTSESMTEVIGNAARRHASAGTQIVALQPYFGAEAVDCNFESYLSAVAVMDRVLAYDEPYDAVVLAGFGEHGRDGLQELIEQPVVEICEASAHVAMMIGRAYSVVTTLQRSVPAIEDRLRLAGLADRCASVRASGMSTLEVDGDPPGAVRAVVAEARKAVRERPRGGDLPGLRGHGRPGGGHHHRAGRAGDRRRRGRGAAGRGGRRAGPADQQGLDLRAARAQGDHRWPLSSRARPARGPVTAVSDARDGRAAR